MSTRRRDAGRASAARCAAVAIALVLTAATLTPSVTSADGDTDDRSRLVLVDQTFVVPAGGPLRLNYGLDGDVGAVERILVDDLTPLPAAEPPEPAPEGADADEGDEGADDVNPDAAPDPGTADEDVVELRPPQAWVVVRTHEPIAERGRVATALAGATGPTIDEVRIPLRDLATRGPDGWSFDIELDTIAGRLTRATDDPGTTDDTSGDGDDNGDDNDDTGDERPSVRLPSPGLHPVSVQIRTTDGRTLARDITFVERMAHALERPPRAQPFGISVVAALPDPGPEPDRLALVDARSRLVEIAQLGEAMPGGLTVSIPAIVASTLPDDELGARVRRALAGSEIIAAPRITFDPSSAVAAGETDAFTRELRDGEDVLARTFPDTSVRRSAWLWGSPLSSSGAALLRDLGVPLLVVPFDDYLTLDNALPIQFTDPSLLYTVVLPGGATMAVAMVDPVSELLTPDLVDPRSPTAIAVEVIATLMATRLQLPDAPRVAVLSTPTLDVPDADVAAAIERLVHDHPDVRVRPLSFVPSSTDVMFVNGVRRDVGLPLSAGPDISRRSDAIASTRDLAASYGSMLPDDDPRHAEWDDELDRMLSTWFDDAEAMSRIDAVAAEIERVPDTIVPPEGYTFTLTGQSSEVTLRITNTGTTPLRVQLRPEAPKLAFPDDTKDVVLEPGANTITMPVTVLSNGTFPVTIDVLTPYDERPVVDPIVLRARATALTGLGQVLTGGALLVLASWWYSHLRSRRRLRSALARSKHPSSSAETLIGS